MGSWREFSPGSGSSHRLNEVGGTPPAEPRRSPVARKGPAGSLSVATRHLLAARHGRGKGPTESPQTP